LKLVKNQTLSSDFFVDLETLHQSCMKFEQVKKDITSGLSKECCSEIVELVKKLEYMIPGQSLNMLSVLIIKLTNQGKMCHRIFKLDMFKLLE